MAKKKAAPSAKRQAANALNATQFKALQSLTAMKARAAGKKPPTMKSKPDPAGEARAVKDAEQTYHKMAGDIKDLSKKRGAEHARKMKADDEARKSVVPLHQLDKEIKRANAHKQVDKSVDIMKTHAKRMREAQLTPTFSRADEIKKTKAVATHGTNLVNSIYDAHDHLAMALDHPHAQHHMETIAHHAAMAIDHHPSMDYDSASHLARYGDMHHSSDKLLSSLRGKRSQSTSTPPASVPKKAKSSSGGIISKMKKKLGFSEETEVEEGLGLNAFHGKGSEKGYDHSHQEHTFVGQKKGITVTAARHRGAEKAAYHYFHGHLSSNPKNRAKANHHLQHVEAGPDHDVYKDRAGVHYTAHHDDHGGVHFAPMKSRMRHESYLENINTIKSVVSELYGLNTMSSTKSGWRRNKVLHKKAGKKLKNTLKKRSNNPGQLAIKMKRKASGTENELERKKLARQRFLQQYKRAGA